MKAMIQTEEDRGGGQDVGPGSPKIKNGAKAALELPTDKFEANAFKLPLKRKVDDSHDRDSQRGGPTSAPEQTPQVILVAKTATFLISGCRIRIYTSFEFTLTFRTRPSQNIHRIQNIQRT